MTRVVIDASAGAEIVTATARGRALARIIGPDRADLAVDRLCRWHLRQAAVAPLVRTAWSRRHNMSAADAVYVALAERLGAALLTDDHRLISAPMFPSGVAVLQLPLR